MEGNQPQPLRTFPLGPIDLEIMHVEPGRAVVELKIEKQHMNSGGRLHGGVMSTLADTAMGIAHYHSLPKGRTAASVEIKVNFLRAVYEGARLRAEGTVIKAGASLSLVECRVHDERGTFVGQAQGTFISLPKP
ncbi:MAG TPA: PaaI family thioesterase [Solibacterales bacterium]|nr:PaaI family thioesterase [Bryobacterales bacterium]